MATLVKFLIHTDDDGEDLFAFFPQSNYNKQLYGNEMKNSYAHMGQHSGCHVEYANESREANSTEYSDLKLELESIGYVLKVLNKS